MYNSKAEAEKDYLYTSRVIGILFLFIALAFVLMTKSNAITFLVIKASPQETTAIFDKSIKQSRYKTDAYFSYVDNNGKLQTYYEFDMELRKEKELAIVYSGFFPHIAYPRNEIESLEVDTYIFLAGFLFCIVFILVVVFYGIRIYFFYK